MDLAQAINQMKRARIELDTSELNQFLAERRETYVDLVRKITLDVMPYLRPDGADPQDWDEQVSYYASQIRAVVSGEPGGFELVLGDRAGNFDAVENLEQRGKEGLTLAQVIEWVEAKSKYGHPLGKNIDLRDAPAGGGSIDAEAVARNYLFSPRTSGDSVINYLKSRESSPGAKVLSGLLQAWAGPVKELGRRHMKEFIRRAWGQ